MRSAGEEPLHLETLLEELTVRGDAVIRAQVRAAELGDEKSKQILGVSLLLMAGGAAAAQMALANESAPDLPFLIMLGGALLSAATAFVSVFRGYVGTGDQETTFRIGWNPSELARIAQEGAYTRLDVLIAHLSAVEQWAAHNARVHERLVSERVAAIMWLFAGGLLLGIAFLYVLGRFY